MAVSASLESLLISLYVNVMETMNGESVSEEQIQAWADEAERGYDFAAMKKRGRGRPGRGAAPSQVVALRLTEDELEALDAHATATGQTRSSVIREALQLAIA